MLRNIRRAKQVWGKLGKLLRRKGADPITSAKFYRAVVQSVLLFGAKTCVLSAAMLNNLLCAPQTRGGDEKGEGTTTYVVSFPRILQ